MAMASKILRSGYRRNCRIYIQTVFQSAFRSISPEPSIISHHYSHRTSSSRSLFGIAFDIDGVLLRGSKPIEGAPEALSQLYENAQPRVPFVFLTNGGGVLESKKAFELSQLLGVVVSETQVLLGHTPFRKLVNSYGGVRTLAVGKGEPASVLSGYGFQDVVSLDEYAFEHDDIDPLKQYKTWAPIRTAYSSQQREKKIGAVFVVSDPIDWGQDIQVICDVLRSGGEPENESGPQPPLFFAADDFLYQSLFPIARFGMGAFRLALESIFTRLTGNPLIYTSFGKPQASVYKDAERTLQHLASEIIFKDIKFPSPDNLKEGLNTTYMIGDNPYTDICGARAAGAPWYSILVRTGCFKGKENDKCFPADKVVDNVQEAVEFILQREGVC
ncbi:hypothetical protein O6H91_07G082500 [Diphasiastrum complanatum]|uniref:Uncharacterized protein n=1 Tax=Diphasiastrum complanatum TaxID=34168 RepID=A0ACC2D749_DIPCM|nr:hypothetical protein O6H91_07G082500 [Diphasiastrum complanatum]